MPRFTADQLRTFTTRMMTAVTVPQADAELTARLLVEANLSGHDTHGVRQVPRYVGLIQKGVIQPVAEVTVVRESPVTAVLDGHHCLGFVAATRAVELAIAKCRQNKLAAVSVRNLNHVGRVGAYPEQITAAGLVGIVTVNAQHRGILVTPFGGLAPRIGTNPFGAGFPNPDGAPVILDFATSAVAANKIRQAHSRGKPTGKGWIIDRQGNPSTDPKLFIDGQALMLPLGGDQGHKGYALGVMVDILSGIMAGSGTALAQTQDLNNGTFIICVDPDAFLPREQYEKELRAYLAYLRETPVKPGAPPVQVPGEYEAAHRAERQKNGIEIEPPVWADLLACAATHSVTPPTPVG
ncbi:MAG: Ldh family oxidoreductase [Deltaproteobacteria bacterium]|nr:Ldh family oxidoreductase [Deltaproteobacteria bacterium]